MILLLLLTIKFYLLHGMQNIIRWLIQRRGKQSQSEENGKKGKRAYKGG